jgi:caffeoyl-CoA O-methyltransferase
VYSDAEPLLLQQLAAETAAQYADRPGAARMASSRLQGRVLAMLASLRGSSSVLELGSFTGYSALCFAYAIKDLAMKRMRNGEKAGLLTCEIDSESADIAQRYFALFNSEFDAHHPVIDLRRGVRAEEVLQQARIENRTFDVVFIDADKKAYKSYLQNLMGEGERSSSGTCLLQNGALVIVDNVLWKGMVLNCRDGDNGDEGRHAVLPPEDKFVDAMSKKRSERQFALARSMHDFNVYVSNHLKLSTVILPIRDGLSCIRYQEKK